MRVLAIGCHPDDVEIGCGGTLARYNKLGHEVFMCHVANGDKGHQIIKPVELEAVRKIEVENASKIIGAKKVFHAGANDLYVNSKDEEQVSNVIEIIRQVKPDLIITHSPDDYMQDHRETSHIVFNASFNASIPHQETKSPFYPKIVPVYYMDTIAGVGFLPDEYVDITDTIEIKLEALSKHESQIKWMKEHDKIDFLDFMRTVSKFRGLQCNASYAEGFKLLKAWPRGTTKRLLP